MIRMIAQSDNTLFFSWRPPFDEDPRADDGVRVYGCTDLWKLERIFSYISNQKVDILSFFSI